MSTDNIGKPLNSKKKRFFSPLLLVNIIGLLTICILVTKGFNDYLHEKVIEEERLYDQWETLLSESEKTTEFIIEMMTQPFKFYLMDTLIQRENIWLREDFGVTMEIILPPVQGVSEEYLGSTYEKVNYWFNAQGRSRDFSSQYRDNISSAFSFIISDIKNGVVSQNTILYKNSSLETYKKTLEGLQADNYLKLVGGKTPDYWYINRNKNVVFELYTSVDRSRDECSSCHGYDQNDSPVYIRYSKFLKKDKAASEKRLRMYLVHKSVDVGIFCFFYAISLWMIQGIVRRQKEQNIQLGYVNENLERSIHEKEQAEKAVRESEQKFRAVAETAMDAIISADSSGSITAWNEGAKRIFGYEKSEILGKPLETIMPEKHEQRHKEGIRRVLRAGKSEMAGKLLQLEGLRKGNVEFPVEFSISSWTVNSTLFFTVILRDITARKQAEKKIEKGLVFERLMSRLSSRLVAGGDLAHPLTLSLEDIGRFVGASSMFLFLGKKGNDFFERSSQWQDNEDGDFLLECKSLSLNESLLWKERLKHHLPVSVFDPSKLPTAAIREKEIMAEFWAHSLVFIPMPVSSELIGLLVACTHAKDESLNKSVLEGLQIASGIISNALMRSEAEKILKAEYEKMEKALSRAVDILGFWEQKPSLIPSFTLSTLFRTSHDVGGGDTIHLLDFRNRFFGLFICDVAGHDIKAILLNIFVNIVAEVQKVNPAINSSRSPSDFMLHMNRALVSFCAGSTDYATAAYVRMDYETGSLDLSLAAHPFPLLISANGTVQKVGVPGDVLGQWDIEPDSIQMYQDLSFKLEVGDLLLVYTDGLMEQENKEGEIFENIFQNAVAPKLAGLTPSKAYTVLKEEFVCHLGGQKSEDDVSFVFVGSRSRFRFLEFSPSRDLSASLDKEFNLWFRAERNLDTYKELLRETKIPLAGCYKDISKELERNEWPSIRIEEVEFVVTELCQNALRGGQLAFDIPKIRVHYALDEEVLELAVVYESVSGILESSGARMIFFNERVGLYSLVEKMADTVRFGSEHLENKIWVLFRKEAEQGSNTT